MREIGKIRKENREIREQLRPEYREVADEMQRYMKVAAYNVYAVELLRKDLMGMVLEGQQRGSEIADILGGDGEDLMKELLVNCRKKNWVEYIFYYLCLIFCSAAGSYCFQWILYQGLPLQAPITTALVFLVVTFVAFFAVADYGLARLTFRGKSRFFFLLAAVFFYRRVANWVVASPDFETVLFVVDWWLPLAATLLGAGLTYLIYVRVVVGNVIKNQ